MSAPVAMILGGTILMGLSLISMSIDRLARALDPTTPITKQEP